MTYAVDCQTVVNGGFSDGNVSRSCFRLTRTRSADPEPSAILSPHSHEYIQHTRTPSHYTTAASEEVLLLAFVFADRNGDQRQLSRLLLHTSPSAHSARCSLFSFSLFLLIHSHFLCVSLHTTAALVVYLKKWIANYNSSTHFTLTIISEFAFFLLHRIVITSIRFPLVKSNVKR